MSVPPIPQKIAVLGGGIASLSTVFELTSQPGWNALYDITVYQSGWRLGGKGASGRTMETPEGASEPLYRIQEHGLHIFFGFYENAFRLMKQCYDELGEDGPIASIEDAFKPHHFVVLEEHFQGRWVHWPFDFPANKLRPWEGGGEFSLWEHIRTILKLMYDGFQGLNTSQTTAVTSPTSPAQAVTQWLEGIAKQIDIGVDAFQVTSQTAFLNLSNQLLPFLVRDPQQGWKVLESAFRETGQTLNDLDLNSESSFLYLAYKFAQLLPENPRLHRPEQHSIILQLLDRFRQRAIARFHQITPQDDNTFRLLTLLDLGFAHIRGLIADGIVFGKSLDSLDEWDYREWLRHHGARESSIDSAFIRVLHGLVYAFPEGNIQQPRLAAGVAIRIFMTVLFQYNGAIMWKMQGGMGDIIFAPLYKVLKRRGVKFKFFHKVENLKLSADQQSIEAIQISRQVNLKANLKNHQGHYDPLIRVKGMLCWPSEPLYDQIVDEEAELLKKEHINLESFWTTWQDTGEPLSLQAGKDFDLVILGISLGALPFICKELIAANPRWQNMVSAVKTVTTQGGQLWLKPNLKQLGWTASSPVVGSYVEPLDTYADMSYLIEKENWPSAQYPYNLAYFTGVIADPGIPDPSHHEFPSLVQQQINQQTFNFLQNQIGHLWPKSTTAENPQGLDWDLLMDLQNQTGEKRFHSQYWRVNIDPSERYILSVPGSTKYRLRTDESGFSNLYLTGDWINNSYNSGCVEATVMAGMQAARAILQQQFKVSYNKPIVGENDDWIRL